MRLNANGTVRDYFFCKNSPESGRREFPLVDLHDLAFWERVQVEELNILIARIGTAVQPRAVEVSSSCRPSSD